MLQELLCTYLIKDIVLTEIIPFLGPKYDIDFERRASQNVEQDSQITWKRLSEPVVLSPKQYPNLSYLLMSDLTCVCNIMYTLASTHPKALQTLEVTPDVFGYDLVQKWLEQQAKKKIIRCLILNVDSYSSFLDFRSFSLAFYYELEEIQVRNENGEIYIFPPLDSTNKQKQVDCGVEKLQKLDIQHLSWLLLHFKFPRLKYLECAYDLTSFYDILSFADQPISHVDHINIVLENIYNHANWQYTQKHILFMVSTFQPIILELSSVFRLFDFPNVADSDVFKLLNLVCFNSKRIKTLIFNWKTLKDRVLPNYMERALKFTPTTSLEICHATDQPKIVIDEKNSQDCCAMDTS
jgi:hypothetical protein